MANFTIAVDTGGKYVLTNHDTGQTTAYATQEEAETAKKHLTEQEEVSRRDQRRDR
jgi:hypothetical protein